jgi:peptidoglycan/LPS O-acetylase OafA/YrhL
MPRESAVLQSTFPETAALAPADPVAAAPAPRAATLPQVRDEVAIGYLRAFVTLLVLAHHAVLAYHPDAPPPPLSLLAQPRWWAAFPVVDPAARWAGFRIFVGFNDTFFMSLMFLLSGLFVWSSLRSRGSAGFIRSRALRLGVPFVAAAALVAPLAYYPAYLETSTHTGVAGFARQWLSLGNWPSGPAWFLWVLLAFDGLAALLFARFPGWGEALGRLAAGARRRPALFLGLLVACSAVAYLPLALTVGPMAWAAFGPFVFQTSRIAHYAVYFLAGVAIGAWGLERGLLAADGALARRWPLWLTAALAAFVAAGVITVLALAPHASPRAWGPAWALSFVLSCACSSLAFLALAVRFVRRRRRPLDSLRANAYGMYIVHYAFATWLQLAILTLPLSGLAKGTLVTLGTVALSWAAVAALRRIPAVARVI